MYAVAVGSGMGCISSGDISDTSFYMRVEKQFMLDPDVRRKYGIKFYARFKDDLLIIQNSSLEVATNLVARMREHSAFFKLKVDEVSRNAVVMLDVLLYKGSCIHDAPLSHTLHVKPSSHWRPLSASSMHHDNVHRAWPKAQVARISSLCKSSQQKSMHLSSFREKLGKAGCITKGLDTPSIRNNQLSNNCNVRYIIMPYVFPLRGLRLNNVFDQIHCMWNSCVSSVNKPLPVPRIAWRLGGPHLHRLLKSMRHNGGRLGR